MDRIYGTTDTLLDMLLILSNCISLGGDRMSIGRRTFVGQIIEARKFSELNEAVLQLVGRVLNSFTEIPLSIRQLFLRKQNLSETNYRSKRGAQFMRQVGDGCRPVFGQFTKFAVLLLEICVNSLQQFDRSITLTILRLRRNP